MVISSHLTFSYLKRESLSTPNYPMTHFFLAWSMVLQGVGVCLACGLTLAQWPLDLGQATYETRLYHRQIRGGRSEKLNVLTNVDSPEKKVDAISPLFCC